MADVFVENKSKNLYSAILGNTLASRADATVKVGGESVTKFIPNINASKWGDETWININNAAVTVKSETQTVAGNKVDLVVGNDCHRYYIDANGNLEYSIIFSSIPKPELLLNLQFSVGLEFIYQPALTVDEITQKAVRPENVVGSYAVYHNRSHNKYQTGKFCHIYRPFLIDAKGNVSWCSIFIDPSANTIQIMMDEKWLAAAAYPVILDPTFGYTTAGASYTYLGASTVYGSVFTAPSDATALTNIIAYCRSYEGGADCYYFKGLLINHSDLNIATNGVGAIVQSLASWSWRTSTFASSPGLTEGTDYILGIIPSNTADQYRWDTGATNQGHFDDSNSYSSPQNLGTITHNNNIYSIYGEYTAAASGQPTSKRFGGVPFVGSRMGVW